jgi:hypothetical protein
MDYVKDDNKIVTDETIKIKNFIIDCLKTNKDEGRKFMKAFTNTEVKVWDTFIDLNLINKYSNELGRYYTLFEKSLNEYDPELVDVIESVLKNEIKQKFSSFNKISKIPNFEYDDDFDNLTFEKLAEQLLKFHTAQILFQRLKYNSEIYKLYYEKNYFENFYFDHIDGHVFNSLVYKKLFKKFNPDKELPCAIEKKDEYGNIKYEITVDNNLASKSKKINKFLVQYKNLVNDLTIDEKLILIHISLSTDNKIDIPEKIKLNILTGGINDFRIFEESSNNNLVYNKVTKGMKYPYKKEKKIAIIESILYKIKICNLTKSNEALTSLLYNINKK